MSNRQWTRKTKSTPVLQTAMVLKVKKTQARNWFLKCEPIENCKSRSFGDPFALHLVCRTLQSEGQFALTNHDRDEHANEGTDQKQIAEVEARMETRSLSYGNDQ